MEEAQTSQQKESPELSTPTDRLIPINSLLSSMNDMERNPYALGRPSHSVHSQESTEPQLDSNHLTEFSDSNTPHK